MSDLMLSTVRMAIQSRPSALEGPVAPVGARVRHHVQPAPADEVPTTQSVKAVAEQIDSYLRSSNRRLDFQVDDQSGQVVVRVRDAATGEVIRQIPGEEILRMARALQLNSPALVDFTV